MLVLARLIAPGSFSLTVQAQVTQTGADKAGGVFLIFLSCGWEKPFEKSEAIRSEGDG